MLVIVGELATYGNRQMAPDRSVVDNPLIRKLSHHIPLSAEHRRELDALTARPLHLGSGETIYREGDDPDTVNVILSGWACRFKILPDGRRQIVALFLPGDMCDPYVFLLGAMDQTVSTITPVTLAKLPASAIRSMTASGPQLTEALWWQTLIAIEVQREWTVNIGRRSAIERLAHLMCEMRERLMIVGLSDGSEFNLPLTQSDLSDALGLSNVHVNRTLQELRQLGLILLRNKHVTIQDHDRLVALAMFDPTYLHRGRT